MRACMAEGAANVFGTTAEPRGVSRSQVRLYTYTHTHTHAYNRDTHTHTHIYATLPTYAHTYHKARVIRSFAVQMQRVSSSDRRRCVHQHSGSPVAHGVCVVRWCVPCRPLFVVIVPTRVVESVCDGAINDDDYLQDGSAVRHSVCRCAGRTCLLARTSLQIICSLCRCTSCRVALPRNRSRANEGGGICLTCMPPPPPKPVIAVPPGMSLTALLLPLLSSLSLSSSVLRAVLPPRPPECKKV